MKSSVTIPVAIVIGGLTVALAIYVSTPKQRTDLHPLLVRPVSASDHILGNPAAKVKIIEYSDFDCDYCKDFHSTLHQIIANEGTRGEVAWVFRSFPISEIHDNALSHARAAECVAEVGGNDAFWKFANALFANQPANSNRYGELAKAAGIVSSTEFATCYANPPKELTDRIRADRDNALDMGATGTPFSLIVVEGKEPIVMDGAYSYDAVRELVEEALH
jgi:protein-disulfide isomerase